MRSQQTFVCPFQNDFMYMYFETCSLFTVCNAEIVFTWGDEGRAYMQALHFCFAMGGILSPMATAPFLAPKHNTFFLHRSSWVYYWSVGIVQALQNRFDVV